MEGPNLVMVPEKTRRQIFLSLYGAVFATMLGIGIVIPLLPGYAESLGASGFWIGLIFSSFALARVLFMPLFGKRSDESGRKILIISGLVLYAVFSLLYIWADTVFSLIAIRFVHGISSAMVFPIALAYISDIAPKGSEGKYMGSFTSCMFLGMGLGPLIGGTLTDFFGIDYAFGAMTLLTTSALFTCLFFLPDVNGSDRRRVSFRQVFSYPGLRIPFFYQMINAFANGTFLVFLPVIAAHVGSLTPGETGIIISISILLNALIQTCLGSIADRFNKYSLICLGSILIGTALAMVPVFEGFYVYVFFSLLMGIGGGISVPAMYALITIAGREVGPGAAMGVVNMIMSGGMIISPLICGAIMDSAGIADVFYLSATIVLLAAPVFLVGSRVDHSTR